MQKSKTVQPISGKHRQVKESNGNILNVPNDWDLLEPGDAGLTRRVKAAGPTWTMKAKRGKRITSIGVWAPKTTIIAEREKIFAERGSSEYKKKRLQQQQYRKQKEQKYSRNFYQEVIAFLNFAPKYQEQAEQMARAITSHSTPVGSGTVARTERIPIEKRAEAAVIAWMRHQTTMYDHMSIARVKGERRNVRRKLAAKSVQLLKKYRSGEEVDYETCPLHQALNKINTPAAEKSAKVVPSKRVVKNDYDSFFLD